MTPKQRRFVEEFLVDLNATQAAVRAGYSCHTARQIGDRLLAKVDIAAAIQSAMNARSKRTEITADRVLEEIARLAFLDIGGAFNADGSLKPLHEMASDVRAAIAGLDVMETFGEDGRVTGRVRKLKLSEKTPALTLLMRHLGMLNDKLKLQGDAENPLTMLLKEMQGSGLKPVLAPEERAFN